MRLRVHEISKATSPRLYVGGPIPDSDRTGIVEVVTEDSSRLWAELVHSDPNLHGVACMPEGHWSQLNEESWMDWYESANHSDRPDTVVPALHRVTGWSESDTVLFLFNKWTIYKTTWGVFLRNWRAFLRMNDEPLIIRPGNNVYICFGSSGGIAWGYRPVHQAESQLEWVSAEPPSSACS
ncbi:DUF2947 family protein [Gemmata algarum]|uniref:DUF2947 family protein n=1 Tax=Gemmata algarum TaxID=2975278 RepID=UPI0038B3E17B